MGAGRDLVARLQPVHRRCFGRCGLLLIAHYLACKIVDGGERPSQGVHGHMRRSELNGLLLMLGSIALLPSSWAIALFAVQHLRVHEFLAIVCLAGTATFAVVVVVVLQANRKTFPRGTFVMALPLLLFHALMSNLVLVVGRAVRTSPLWH